MSADSIADPLGVPLRRSVGSAAKADTLGMWIFLATEVMFFGGLFTAYIVYRIATVPALSGSGARIRNWSWARSTPSCSDQRPHHGAGRRRCARIGKAEQAPRLLG